MNKRSRAESKRPTRGNESAKLACKSPSGGTSVMAFRGLEESPPLYRGCQFSCRQKREKKETKTGCKKEGGCRRVIWRSTTHTTFARSQQPSPRTRRGEAAPTSSSLLYTSGAARKKETSSGPLPFEKPRQVPLHTSADAHTLQAWFHTSRLLSSADAQTHTNSVWICSARGDQRRVRAAASSASGALSTSKALRRQETPNGTHDRCNKHDMRMCDIDTTLLHIGDIESV